METTGAESARYDPIEELPYSARAHGPAEGVASGAHGPAEDVATGAHGRPRRAAVNAGGGVRWLHRW